MDTKKILFSLVLAFAIAAFQMGTAAAQTGTPVPPWTINSITLETDPVTGDVTGVVLDMTDDLGQPQTQTLTLDEAVTLGLVTVDGTTGDVTINDVTEIDPTTLPSAGEEEETHPVASALEDFFGVEGIMDAHDEGFGFGVIAQALWMSESGNLKEGATFQEILDAKESGDYSTVLDCEEDCPTNWGQFKKEVMDGDKGKNLGSVMSGKATPPPTDATPEPGATLEPTAEPTEGATTLGQSSLSTLGAGTIHGNSGTHGHGKGGGKGKGKGHNK